MVAGRKWVRDRVSVTLIMTREEGRMGLCRIRRDLTENPRTLVAAMDCSIWPISYPPWQRLVDGASLSAFLEDPIAILADLSAPQTTIFLALIAANYSIFLSHFRASPRMTNKWGIRAIAIRDYGLANGTLTWRWAARANIQLWRTYFQSVSVPKGPLLGP